MISHESGREIKEEKKQKEHVEPILLEIASTILLVSSQYSGQTGRGSRNNHVHPPLDTVFFIIPNSFFEIYGYNIKSRASVIQN